MEVRQRKLNKNAAAKNPTSSKQLINVEGFKYKTLTLVSFSIITAIFAIVVSLYWSHSVIVKEQICVLHKDAKSALNRAKSPQCKESLKTIACQAENELYPQNIQSSCDFYQELPYLGCFQDYSQNRILQNGSHKVNLKLTNSPEECARYCYERKFPLAGLQYGRECFCGETVDSSHKITKDKCDITCPGDESKKCGGYYTMNIYETKFKPPQILKDETVRIAYLFIVHGRSLRQVYRLFKKLYNPEDFFYFHVDSRSEYMYGHLKEKMEMNELKNVKVTDNRFATIWGGKSHLFYLS